MKQLITAIIPALFVLNAGATDIYHGLGRGNTDLSVRAEGSTSMMRASTSGDMRDNTGYYYEPQMAGSAPVDIYHDFATGNSDLINRQDEGMDTMLTGMQRGVGDTSGKYRYSSEENPFLSSQYAREPSEHGLPSIYGNLSSGSSDLDW